MDNNPDLTSYRSCSQSRGINRFVFGLNRKMLLAIVIAVVGLGLIGLSLVIALQGPPQSKDGIGGTGSDNGPGADTSSVVSQLPADQLGVPSKSPSDPRTSILLLGYGGGGHEGAYLTDSMVLAIGDPAKKTITLLSIPRDSWVPQVFDGKSAVYNKVNTAYAYAKDTSLYRNRLDRYKGSHGAGNLTMDTVSRALGIPVSNYFGLDFDGFRQMINTVGGIDVNVPASFRAQYPANDDPSIDPSWMVVRFTKGMEHMNGERAIQYARARESLDNIDEGSDFARSRRQRIIMEAFKTRLLEPGGLVHLPQIMVIMASHVDTDYPVTAAGQLSQLVSDWGDVKIYQTALTVNNYLSEATGPGGAYILIPNSPDHSWTQVRSFVRRLWDDPATGVAMADTKIIVSNDSGEAGAATRLTAALRKLGYRVGPPLTGPDRTDSLIVDRTGGKAKLVIEQLDRDLGVYFIESSEKPNSDANELVLHLGSNDKDVANLLVASDDSAPSGSVGVQNFDGWAPQVAVPAVETSIPVTPTGTITGTRQATPRPSGSPGIQPPRGTITSTTKTTVTPQSGPNSPSGTPTSNPATSSTNIVPLTPMTVRPTSPPAKTSMLVPTPEPTQRE